MKTPIQLIKVTKAAKVAPESWKRAADIAEQTGATVGDIVSICLSYMPEADILRILDEHRKAVNTLPKNVRSLLTNVHKLDDEQKAMLREILASSS